MVEKKTQLQTLFLSIIKSAKVFWMAYCDDLCSFTAYQDAGASRNINLGRQSRFAEPQIPLKFLESIIIFDTIYHYHWEFQSSNVYQQNM